MAAIPSDILLKGCVTSQFKPWSSFQSCACSTNSKFPRHFSVKLLRRTRKATNTARLRAWRCACASAGNRSSTDHDAHCLYGLLGVKADVGLAEIKSAFRRMALQYHPDVCPPTQRDQCTKKFLELQRAYEILSDPETRANYDYSLMHPSFAQAFGMGGGFSKKRNQRAGQEGVSDAWKLQWEAQLTRLKHKEREQPTVGESWGARMRRQQQSP